MPDRPPGAAERRPRAGSGAPDDDHGGGNVPVSVTEKWFGATLYAVTRHAPRDPDRGLADALDHLDSVGLCCCWVRPRRHRAGRAA